jgi:hypothetical protein
MRNHPEEFNSGGKFFWVIQAQAEGRLDFLTEAERYAFKCVFDTMRYRYFHDKIFSAVLEDTR